MILRLIRMGLGKDSTLGKLYLLDDFLCFTLEDERRDVKVWGETCIPEGEYDLALRDFGGKHEDYEKRFPGMHKGMIWVKDVDGFEDILFHIGNFEKDTAGCVLLGTDPKIDNKGEFTIYNSRDMYRRVYPNIAKRILAGEPVLLQVTVKGEE